MTWIALLSLAAAQETPTVQIVFPDTLNLVQSEAEVPAAAPKALPSISSEVAAELAAPTTQDDDAPEPGSQRELKALPSVELASESLGAQAQAKGSDPTLGLSPSGVDYKRGSIDQELLARLLQAKLELVEGYALEDAAYEALEYAPVVTVDVVRSIIEHLLDERSAETLEIAVADDVSAMLLSTVGGLLVAAFDHHALFDEPVPGVNKRHSYELRAGVFYADLAYSALRSDAELRDALELADDPPWGICSQVERGTSSLSLERAGLPEPAWRYLFEPSDKDEAGKFKGSSTDKTTHDPAILEEPCERVQVLGRAVLAAESGELDLVEAMESAKPGTDADDRQQALWQGAVEAARLLQPVVDALREGPQETVAAIVQVLSKPEANTLFVEPRVWEGSAAAYHGPQAERQNGKLSRKQRRRAKSIEVLKVVLDSLGSSVTFDAEQKSIDVDVLSVANGVSRNWYTRSGFVPYLTIGSGFTWSDEAAALGDFQPIAAERVGIVYRHKLHHPATAKTRRQAASSLHAGAYGSGILYSVALDGQDTTTMLTGVVAGMSVYGVIEANGFAAMSYDFSDATRGYVLGVSADIPLHEYIEAVRER